LPFSTAFEKRREQITAVEVPPNYRPKIPAMAYHEEALLIYQLGRRYEKELCEAGLDKKILLDIPDLVAASMEAQSRWLECMSGDLDIEKEWKLRYEDGRKFHDKLYQELHYYFSVTGIDRFSKMFKSGYMPVSDMVQDFNDFAVLIRTHGKSLSEAGMDISQEDKAYRYCSELSDLYATYKLDAEDTRKKLKNLRNQTLIYLSESISLVQKIAFFRFRNDPLIQKAFTSEYRRNHRVRGESPGPVVQS
jgi:hypothetical protein